MQVWVRARDGGGLAGEAPVLVHVLGAREQAPRVAPPPADLFLREDAAPGTLIAELRAAGPAPRYRLAPALWPRDLFAVDAAGRLLLAGQLDREAAADHLIGDAPLRASLTILYKLDCEQMNYHRFRFIC